MNRLHFDNKNLRRLARAIQLGGLVCVAAFSGCQRSADTPVNMNLAQKTLESAMQTWKEGKSSKELLKHTPSIVVQEAEWNDQTKLLDYEIINNDHPAGPNLIAVVKLKLSGAEGNVTEKTATYVVGTSPSLTVYRNIMR